MGLVVMFCVCCFGFFFFFFLGFCCLKWYVLFVNELREEKGPGLEGEDREETNHVIITIEQSSASFMSRSMYPNDLCDRKKIDGSVKTE